MEFVREVRPPVIIDKNPEYLESDVSDFWSFYLGQFEVNVLPSPESLEFVYDDSLHILPEGTTIAIISVDEGSSKARSLFKTFQGMVLFIDELERQDPVIPIDKMPEFFYAETHPSFAALAQRVGFSVIEDNGGGIVRIIGKIENVKSALCEQSNSNGSELSIIEKLYIRLKREEERQRERYKILSAVLDKKLVE